MRIKRIRAKDMVSALRKIKEELGEKAVILDSGKVKEDGMEFYEVVAAIEEIEIERELSFPEPHQEDKHLSFPKNFYRDLKKDLEEIKKIIKGLVPGDKSSLFYSLIKEGVPEDIIEEIEKSSQALEVFITNSLKKKGVSPRSPLYVFIGEPGVGKTTTLFKLAFWTKVHKKAQVAIVSVDNYKIGGREQSQKLSQLLEIPYYQSDWEDLKNFYEELTARYQWILVDTPSLDKKFSLYDLYEVFQYCSFLRFYWVVRVTEHSENILSLWENLKNLPVDGLILTFLDKLVKGYKLFWILKEDIPLPLFGGTGERIPEDLEALEIKGLLNLFLKGINKEEFLENGGNL